MDNRYNIVEAYGKFFVKVDNDIKKFDHKADAETAISLEKNKEAINRRVDAYCNNKELTKRAETITRNLLTDFIAFEAAELDIAEEGLLETEEI